MPQRSSPRLTLPDAFRKQTLAARLLRPGGLLLVTLLLAGILRLVNLGRSPAGWNVDEAAVAWNAYCLLKTGTDQHGVRWPIFLSRGFGQGLTTPYLYLSLPFQAIGGLNLYTARLPAAIGGVIVVLLIYLVGARLFDPWTGLLAAAFLAASPWHLQQSRWGHESSLTPLLIMLPLALLLWANAPFSDQEPRRLDPIRAVVAGLVTGLCCYGYLAVRLFLPLFLLSAVLVTWRAWQRCFKTRDDRIAIVGLLMAVTLTFGPLAWKFATDPEISKRAQVTWVWSASDTLGQKIAKALARYPGHFAPNFLFISGDQDIAYSPPPNTGLFHWYMLPLMILGLAVLLGRFRSSRAARFLTLWVLLYPTADLLNEHPTLHALRSLPGLCALTLLASVGVLSGAKWLWQRQHIIATVTTCGFAVVILLVNISFLTEYFGAFNRQPEKYFAFHVDILEACQWLRARQDNVDAVFFTGTGIPHPYIYTLVGLQYDPLQWFLDQRESIRGPLPDGSYKSEEIYTRYGKFYFLFSDDYHQALDKFARNGRSDHVILVLRPGELGLEKYARPIHEIRNPEGEPVLWIFDLYM